MIKKHSYIQMSFEITDAEKYDADVALQLFKQAYDKLKVIGSKINQILTPFKEDPNIPPEQIMSQRYFLRKYRDQLSDEFHSFQEIGKKCLNKMKRFSFDSNTGKLIKSFSADVSVLENLIQDFNDLFSDLQNKDFAPSVISICDNLKSKISDLEDLIDDRIKKHIKENILSQSWEKSDEASKMPVMLDIERKE